LVCVSFKTELPAFYYLVGGGLTCFYNGRQADIPVRVLANIKAPVGSGEEDATMSNTKAIEHIFRDALRYVIYLQRVLIKDSTLRYFGDLVFC
jgi:hypothetical protein